MNVVTVTFMLPLNAAINPFLYTLNLVLEQRASKKEKLLLEKLKANPLERIGEREP